MRRSIALFAFIASFVMAAAGFAQAADPPASSSVKGLFLVTDYPSQTVRAGEITTIRVKLANSGLPPEPVALSLSDVPAGWKVDILGGGQSVASAMPGINQDIGLQLRVDVPKDAKPGSQKVVLSAKGPLTQAPDLVFTLTVGTETPAKLSLKSRLPSLRGTPRSASSIRSRSATTAARISPWRCLRRRRPTSRPPSPKASAPTRSARSRSKPARPRT